MGIQGQLLGQCRSQPMPSLLLLLLSALALAQPVVLLPAPWFASFMAAHSFPLTTGFTALVQPSDRANRAPAETSTSFGAVQVRAALG